MGYQESGTDQAPRMGCQESGTWLGSITKDIPRYVIWCNESKLTVCRNGQ